MTELFGVMFTSVEDRQGRSSKGEGHRERGRRMGRDREKGEGEWGRTG